MDTPRKWAVGLGLSALLCGAAACSSSSGQPGSTSTATSSNPPTVAASATTGPVTPGATPTTNANIPADARPATADGAQKFAAYWVAQFNLAYRKADGAPIQVLSTTECVACQKFISDVETLRDNGEHADGDVWTINDSYIETFDNVASASVIATIKQNPVARVSQSGSVVANFNDRTEDAAFTLQHTGAGWRVIKFQVVK